MKRLTKLFMFIIIYLLVSQIALPFMIPSDMIYNYRIKYNVFKDNPDSIGVTLDVVQRDIESQKLTDYIILFGDSVGFSTPADEYGSLGYYLNQLADKEGYKTKIFNLSIPSEYPGDIYTLIKQLDKRGISTDHLIINLNYFEFLFDQKYPGVFWLKEQLRDVDKEAYEHVYGVNNQTDYKTLKNKLSRIVNAKLHLLSYKDYIREQATFTLVDPKKLNSQIRPWYEKKYLQAEMKKPDNQWLFSDKPMVLDESRASIYFINKIIAHQKGKDTLIFLPGYNRELLTEETAKDGFNNNLKRLDAFFESKPVRYVNYDRKIDYRLYSDHVHLLPEGYAVLAEDLWMRIKEELK